MPPPTNAVLESRLTELQGRVNRSEADHNDQLRGLRESNERHELSDKEEFAEQRKRMDGLGEQLNEIKVMLAEHLAVQEDVGLLKTAVETLKLTHAGTQPWIDMLMKLIWALLGAGIAWVLSHGGVPGL